MLNMLVNGGRIRFSFFLTVISTIFYNSSRREFCNIMNVELMMCKWMDRDRQSRHTVIPA